MSMLVLLWASRVSLCVFGVSSYSELIGVGARWVGTFSVVVEWGVE